MRINLSQTLILTLLLASCMDSGGGGGKRKSDQLTIDIDDEIEGEYLAVLSNVNKELTGKITGAFTFARDKEIDELVMDVRLNNGGSKLVHAQYVRTGERCPDVHDDLNHDGIIDGKEGEAVYGRVFIPLDGDISSQPSHDGEFPVGDIYGNYIYSRVTEFTRFIKDMRGSDPEGQYIKLGAKERLEIEGKVVVIHGVDPATDLPETVSSANRVAPHLTLPIACGVIQKILTRPGEIDDGVVDFPEETTEPRDESL